MIMDNPRILVIRGGAIGDFIQTLPAIGALRRRWPEAHIEILGYSHIIGLADGRYYARRTRSIEYGPMSGFFVPNGTLDKALSEYFAGFQLVVSYLYDPDKFFEANLRRVGVKLLVTGAPKPAKLPAAAHLAKPLEALAIYVDSPQPRLYPSESDLEFGRTFLGAPAGHWIAVHCGSGSPAKNWPVDSFAAVCQRLGQTWQGRIVVISGEADDAVTAELRRMLPSETREARGLSLVQVSGILANCRVYLGNDSGITHLSAAVGVPTIALWGPSSPAVWQPVGPNVRVIPFDKASPGFVADEIRKLLRAA